MVEAPRPFQDIPSLQIKWDAYLAAREEAEESSDIKDGIRAGLAWRAWLDAYLTEVEARGSAHHE